MAPRKQRVEEVVPSAARTVESLRDVGYELTQAVADLVDNSISARAREVNIDLRFAGSESWIRIADDGGGMDTGTLTEAMRYGSERDYDTDDLGKFGFGLKTASTSQCRRLTVGSRTSTQRARVNVRCLDLDHIERTNRWEILVLEGSDRSEHVLEPLQGHPGTVVLWQRLDRVLSYADPWGEWARRRLLGSAEEIDLHLGMVFHRFLAGAVRGRRLKLTVNGTVVEPWDPFCVDEPETETIEPVDIEVTAEGVSGIVRVRPFVLPPQAEFSSDSAWRRASGPRKWNRQQGFYIYRANRLIQSGGWNGIRTFDEHNKLARVALDFYPELDPAFEINISKARVTLPADLQRELEPIVAATVRGAQRRYRSGSGRPSSSGSGRRASGGSSGGASPPGGGGGSEEAAGGNDDGQSTSPTNAGDGASTVPTPQLREALEASADRTGQGKALKRIVKDLKATNVEVARDLGW